MSLLARQGGVAGWKREAQRRSPKLVLLARLATRIQLSPESVSEIQKPKDSAATTFGGSTGFPARRKPFFTSRILPGAPVSSPVLALSNQFGPHFQESRGASRCEVRPLGLAAGRRRQHKLRHSMRTGAVRHPDSHRHVCDRCSSVHRKVVSRTPKRFCVQGNFRLTSFHRTTTYTSVAPVSPSAELCCGMRPGASVSRIVMNQSLLRPVPTAQCRNGMPIPVSDHGVRTSFQNGFCTFVKSRADIHFKRPACLLRLARPAVSVPFSILLLQRSGYGGRALVEKS